MYCLNITANGYLEDTLYCRTSSLAKQLSNAFRLIYKECVGKEVSCHTYKLVNSQNRKVIISKEQFSFDIDLKLFKTDTDRLIIVPNIKLYHMPSHFRVIPISEKQYTVRVPLDRLKEFVSIFNRETLSQSMEVEMFHTLLNKLDKIGGVKNVISI